MLSQFLFQMMDKGMGRDQDSGSEDEDEVPLSGGALGPTGDPLLDAALSFRPRGGECEVEMDSDEETDPGRPAMAGPGVPECGGADGRPLDALGAILSYAAAAPVLTLDEDRALLLKIMQDRFMNGLDGDAFPYATVDSDEALDVCVEARGDAEEAWFSEQ